jgi:hypothetical protein
LCSKSGDGGGAEGITLFATNRATGLKKASEALDGYIINSPDDIGMFKLRELPYAGSSTIEMLWYQVEWFSNLTKDQAGFIQDWWDEEGERKWATT